MTDQNQTTDNELPAGAFDSEIFVPAERMAEEASRPTSDKAAKEDANALDVEEGDALHGDKGSEKTEKPDTQRAERNARGREGYLAREARRQAREAQARIDALERQLSELSGGRDKTTQPPEKPKRPDFDKYDLKEIDPQYLKDLGAYEDARDEYNRALAAHEAREAANAAYREAAAAREHAALENRLHGFYKKGVDKHPDFHDVVLDAFEAMPDAPEAVKTIAELENADDVLYHLANSPEELEEIAALEPRAQALELGKLSVRLAYKAKAEKQITRAPRTPDQPRGSNGQFATAEDAMYDRFLRGTAI